MYDELMKDFRDANVTIQELRRERLALEDKNKILAQQLAACEAERKQLLNALCSTTQGQKQVDVTSKSHADFPRHRTWSWSATEQKIHAIRKLRHMTNMGLAQAKSYLEAGSGDLTDNEANALAPYVVFTN